MKLVAVVVLALFAVSQAAPQQEVAPRVAHPAMCAIGLAPTVVAVGYRAYNVVPQLRTKAPELMNAITANAMRCATSGEIVKCFSQALRDVVDKDPALRDEVLSIIATANMTFINFKQCFEAAEAEGKSFFQVMTAPENVNALLLELESM